MITTRVKVFCDVYTDQLEKAINEWVESDPAERIHWSCMGLTSLVGMSNDNETQSAFGVVIPYEPKQKMEL